MRRVVEIEQPLVSQTMSDDPLKRARQMLQGVSKSGTPASLDQAKLDDLLARGRAAASRQPEQLGSMHVASPPPVSAETVRLQMTCSATGGAFTAIAERRGTELRLIDHEPPKPGLGSGTPAERLSGEYIINLADGWTCPLCQSHQPGWSCSCPDHLDALHCGGRQGRRQYCACGRLESRAFEEVEFIAVRGQSVGRRSRRDASSSPSSSRGFLALPGKR
jgi:hypothetical protein